MPNPHPKHRAQQEYLNITFMYIYIFNELEQVHKTVGNVDFRLQDHPLLSATNSSAT